MTMIHILSNRTVHLFLFCFALIFSLNGQVAQESDNQRSVFRNAAAQTGYNLPLVIIETGNREIPREPPRIQAEMGIINNSDGVNHPNDPWNEYSGRISIKIRGETSSNFPKKSFTLELQRDDGSNNNMSVLGLPVENDFVIYSPHSDKTMIKNVLTYELFRRAGHWAPKTRYVEVFLNGDYRGVSVFTESIKRDDNRVDIDKLKDDDITGGYLLRRDKKHDLEPEEWWTNPVDQPYHEQMWYEYFDPERDELTDDEANYIQNWMRDFNSMMSGSDFGDPKTGYDGYIKTKSFIDMMFINEISKGIDNYLFSTYFHKESDEDGGQFAAGPPWDYNMSYGNLNYGHDWNSSESYGWCYTQGSRVYWFERLMEDDLYRTKTMCRWSMFRANIYSDQSIMAIIDSCVYTLGPAVDRNFEKFNILGEYVWPAKEPIPETYAGEIDQLKSWTLDRLAWIDDQWLDNGNCSDVAPTGLYFNQRYIEQGTPPGSKIGQLSIEDEDKWDYHKYKFVSGAGDDDNDIFYVEGNVLYTVDDVDAGRSTYSFRVRATDSGGDQIEKSFELEVVADLSKVLSARPKDAISVFPNPTHEVIQIEYDAFNKDTRVKAVILTVSGTRVFQAEGTLEKINDSLHGATTELSPGVYIIHISDAQNDFTKRFVKY